MKAAGRNQVLDLIRLDMGREREPTAQKPGHGRLTRTRNARNQPNTRHRNSLKASSG